MEFQANIEACLRKQMSDAYEFARLMSGERSGSTSDRTQDQPPMPAATYIVKDGRIVPKVGA